MIEIVKDFRKIDAERSLEASPDVLEISHFQSGLGTPLRKDGVAEVYIYELFDETDVMISNRSELWGILYPNMTKKYNIDFSSSAMGMKSLESMGPT